MYEDRLKPIYILTKKWYRDETLVNSNNKITLVSNLKQIYLRIIDFLEILRNVYKSISRPQ